MKPVIPSSKLGGRYSCNFSTCWEIKLSLTSFISSVTTNTRSKRDNNESGSAIL